MEGVPIMYFANQLITGVVDLIVIQLAGPYPFDVRLLLARVLEVGYLSFQATRPPCFHRSTSPSYDHLFVVGRVVADVLLFLAFDIVHVRRRVQSPSPESPLAWVVLNIGEQTQNSVKLDPILLMLDVRGVSLSHASEANTAFCLTSLIFTGTGLPRNVIF